MSTPLSQPKVFSLKNLSIDDLSLAFARNDGKLVNHFAVRNNVIYLEKRNINCSLFESFKRFFGMSETSLSLVTKHLSATYQNEVQNSQDWENNQIKEVFAKIFDQNLSKTKRPWYSRVTPIIDSNKPTLTSKIASRIETLSNELFNNANRHETCRIMENLNNTVTLTNGTLLAKFTDETMQTCISSYFQTVSSHYERLTKINAAIDRIEELKPQTTFNHSPQEIFSAEFKPPPILEAFDKVDLPENVKNALTEIEYKAILFNEITRAVYAISRQESGAGFTLPDLSGLVDDRSKENIQNTLIACKKYTCSIQTMNEIKGKSAFDLMKQQSFVKNEQLLGDVKEAKAVFVALNREGEGPSATFVSELEKEYQQRMKTCEGHCQEIKNDTAKIVNNWHEEKHFFSNEFLEKQLEKDSPEYIALAEALKEYKEAKVQHLKVVYNEVLATLNNKITETIKNAKEGKSGIFDGVNIQDEQATAKTLLNHLDRESAEHKNLTELLHRHRFSYKHAHGISFITQCLQKTEINDEDFNRLLTTVEEALPFSGTPIYEYCIEKKRAIYLFIKNLCQQRIAPLKDLSGEQIETQLEKFFAYQGFYYRVYAICSKWQIPFLDVFENQSKRAVLIGEIDKTTNPSNPVTNLTLFDRYKKWIEEEPAAAGWSFIKKWKEIIIQNQEALKNVCLNSLASIKLDDNKSDTDAINEFSKLMCQLLENASWMSDDTIISLCTKIEEFMTEFEVWATLKAQNTRHDLPNQRRLGSTKFAVLNRFNQTHTLNVKLGKLFERFNNFTQKLVYSI